MRQRRYRLAVAVLAIACLARCTNETMKAIDIVIDPSAGSTTTVDALGETLEATIRHAAQYPRCELVVWVTRGVRVEDATAVFRTTAPKASSIGGRHARERRQERWIEKTTGAAMKAIGRVQPTERAGSPLAEILTRIGMSREGSMQHTVVLLSDGKQYSRLAQWECRPIPEIGDSIARAEELGILQPGTLQATRVHFSFADITPVAAGRCDVDLAQERRRRETWTALLRRAGATTVSFHAGPPELP